MNFLNEKYKNLGKSKFLTLAALLCFMSDIGNVTYINVYWLGERLKDRFLGNVFALQGIDIRMMTPYQLKAYKEILFNSLGFMFMFFMAYHIIVYFKMSRDKLWAKKYVYGYALTGTFLTLFELPMLIQDNLLWAIFMILTTIIYIYTFLGIKFFKKEEQ